MGGLLHGVHGVVLIASHGHMAGENNVMAGATKLKGMQMDRCYTRHKRLKLGKI